MDVNGVRFHLVLGRDDWLPSGSPVEGASWNARDATVELEPLPVVFPPRKAERPPVASDRRGAGRDRYGNWYWIDPDARSIVARAYHGSSELPFWPNPDGERAADTSSGSDFAPVEPPPPPPPPRLQGLAVTTEHYLVAGNLDEPGLIVFDLAAGGPPVALPWPEEVPFVPWDICSTPDGGAWVLDRENARLWSLDRLFRVRQRFPSPLPLPAEPDFTAPAASPPGGEAESEIREGPVTVEAALDLASVLDPGAVEVLCDGSALILGRDGTGPVVHRFTVEEGETGVYPIAPLLYAHPEVLRDLPYAAEFAFVPLAGCSGDALAGQLFLVAADGNQCFAFTVSGPASEPELAFDPRFFPMRRFGGRALVAADGEAHYDSGDRWVSLLEYPRPSFAREAVLRLPTSLDAAFDGRDPGCVWHRLFLDACIPPEASITVESRAGDDRAELEGLEWQIEAVPYLRAGGPELPYRSTFPPGPAGQAGTWELLFQNAVGRYLQLRITLRGNGRITPRLRAVRAYYPRFSYLREYLPAVYREDAASASFLDRYLANVEGTLTEVEERIAAAQMLFDTRTVPAEFLEWLAGWMGAALDAAWSEEKKRFFLGHAMRMYAGRGTREGLIRALRLALEECVDPTLFDEASGDDASATGSAGTRGDCGCDGGSGRRRTAGGGAGARFTVRVVEQFLARGASRVAYGDVGGLAGPSTTTSALEWSPAQGPEPLHRRWRAWLATRYATVDALEEAWDDPSGYASLDDPRLELPAVAPAGAAKAEDWRRFLREDLGFTYVAPEGAGALGLWRDFLARRYRQPADLNRAWRVAAGSAYSTFDAVDFPDSLPENRTALADWITFVSVVVPMRQSAHRFTVLVPTGAEDDRETQQKRRELARRIAMLEKPAHTVVDTRLYWAAFRVGEARLGMDTLLGQGSRFTALVLDRGELAASHLGWTEPWNVRGRLVVGRDPVTSRPPSGISQRWT